MSESLTEKCSTHLISAEGGNKKKNRWLSDSEYCFSCHTRLIDRPDYESLTGCPNCNRSFVE